MRLKIQNSSLTITNGLAGFTAEHTVIPRQTEIEATVPRTEIDDKNAEIVHVIINDNSLSKEAHFHLVVGIKNGRPYAEITAIGKSPFKDKRKKLTAPWKVNCRRI